MPLCYLGECCYPIIIQCSLNAPIRVGYNSLPPLPIHILACHWAFMNCYILYTSSLSGSLLTPHQFSGQVKSSKHQDKVLSLGRTVIVYTLAGWCLIVLQLVFESVLLWRFHVYEENLLPFTPSSPYVVEVRTVVDVTMTFSLGSWLLTPMLYGCVCSSLQHEFQKVRRSLQQLCKQGIPTSREIHEIRLHHQKACLLVERMDGIFSLHAAMMMVLGVVTVCLLIYVLIWTGGATGGVMGNVARAVWVSLSVILMLMILLAASAVSEQVR